MSNEITIRIKGDNDLKPALSAAESDAKRAGERIGDNLWKSADGRLKDARGRFGKLGDETGHSFGLSMAKSAAGTLMHGMSEGMSSLGAAISKSPHLIAGGTAIGAVLAPVIGAALNSAMLVGAGGGVLAAGIAAAAKSPAVKSAFEPLKATAQRVFADFGSAFEGPVARSMDVFRNALQDLGPSFNRMGAAMAPLVDKFAPALADMARNAMPGIERAVESAAPLLESLAQHLPKLGSAIGDFFDSMADGAPGALAFFDMMLSSVEGTIQTFGLLIEGASRAFDVMAKGFSGDFKGALEAAGGFMFMLHDQTEEATEGQITFASATARSTRAVRGQSQSVEALSSAMQRLKDGFQAGEEAEMRFQEALDNATAGLKDNGRAFNDSTEKGRANKKNLFELANTSRDLAAQLDRQGAGVNRVNGAMARGADAVFRMGLRMGMTSRQAFDLTTKLMGVPPRRETIVGLQGYGLTRGQVTDLLALLGRFRDRYVTVHVGANVSARASQFLGSSASDGSYGRGGYAHGGIVGTAANGGLRSGMTLVGEHGPELVQLPPGSHVHSNPDSQRLVKNAKYVEQRALYSAAMETLARLRHGGSLFEDLSWHGMSKNASAHNDKLAGMFERTHQKWSGANLMRWLSTFKPPAQFVRPKASHSSSHGSSTFHSSDGVTITLTTQGVYDDFLKLLRKMVRIEGGGSVQKAFGR